MKFINLGSSVLSGLIAVASVLSIGCDALSVLPSTGSSRGSANDHEKVMEMFRDASEDCPTRVDEWTTLVAVNILDDHNIEFRYEVSDEGRNIVRQIPKEQLRRHAIASMKAKRMVVAVAKKDLSIQHIYEDRYGSYVLSYTINKQVLDGNLYPMGGEKSNPFAVDDQVVKKSVAEQIFATEVGMTSDDDVQLPQNSVDSELPTQFKAPQRSKKDNPAGVQENPFLGA